MRGFRILIMLSILPLFACSRADAATVWFEPAESAVTNRNDCGIVSAVVGEATAKGQFASDMEKGVAVDAFDRVAMGDELETGPNARLEFSTGTNLLSLLDSESKVKVASVKVFHDSTGRYATRLVVRLLHGSVRVQCRLNIETPESVMVEAGGVSVLLAKGDVIVSTAKGWTISVLDGEMLYRTPNGDIHTLNLGEVATQNADIGSLSEKEVANMMIALPFSYETHRAALPPMPPPDPFAEAP